MFDIRKKQIQLFIYASIIIVIGILFCAVPKTAVDVLSVIIGVIFILSGVLAVLDCAITKKTCLSKDSIYGAFILAFGILFITNKLGGLVLDYIPYVLIVLGSCIIIDALILIAYRKEKAIIVFVFEVAIGLSMLVLGILMLTSNNFKDSASLVFGLVLITLGVFIMLLSIFAKKILIRAAVNQAVDDVQEDLNEYMNAEYEEKNSQN